MSEAIIKEELPRIYLGRIQKYWDRIIPTTFPHSSSVFATDFRGNEKEAVDTMEAELTTEHSVITPFVPEGSYVAEYAGVYDVDAKPGVKTLLSPQKVDPNAEIIALHWDEKTNGWVKVENVENIDGYVWGSLESFSPIAVFTTKREIELRECKVAGYFTGNGVICNGNAVIATTKQDGKHYVRNVSTGKEVEIPRDTFIIGGTDDGTYVESTSVTLDGAKLGAAVIGGSINNSTADPVKVGTVNVRLVNGSTSNAAVGFVGAVRTDTINITMDHSSTNYLSCGDTIIQKNDANAEWATATTLASKSWTKKFNAILNGATVYLAYTGGQCGYSYTVESKLDANDSKFYYVIGGGSNGQTDKATLNLVNCDVNIFQSVNRGIVHEFVGKIYGDKSKYKHIFIGGDATDATVTGKTEKITVEVERGVTGPVEIGFEAGAYMTREQADKIVNYVKVSRSSNTTVDEKTLTTLGNKYIVK